MEEEKKTTNPNEKNEVKNWYKNINAEYLDDHNMPETVYGYRDGEYFMLTAVKDGKTVVYKRGDETVDKSYVKNAYTNLVNPALSKHA